MQLDRAGRPFTPHHLATETQLCTGGDRVPPLQILQHRRGAPREAARGGLGFQEEDAVE
ncbi:hypothetical protein MY10362_002827 [Beauveria mimosiformis]